MAVLVSAIHPFLLSSATLLGISAADLRIAGLYVLFLVAAVTVHEFAHAYAAHRLGDPTAESQGRLTLNPISHADPVGTLVLPIVLAVASPGLLFGWGRPVPYQARFFTRKVSMRFGAAIVAFAGPLANLIMALATLLVVFALSSAEVLAGPLPSDSPLRLFFNLNVLLFVFNLLPVHPLDGGKVLAWLLGARHQAVDDFLAQWGGIILIALVLSRALDFLFAPFLLWANFVLDAVV